MLKAIEFYSKAIPVAPSPKDRASARKNIGVTQLRLAERYHRLQKYRSKMSKVTREQRDKDIPFFLTESLKNLETAMEEGAGQHPHEWSINIQDRRQEGLELLWSFVKKNNASEDFKVLAGRLHQFCWSLDKGHTRSDFFLRLGRLTFSKAVQYQETGRYKESLQLLHDNHLAIEEAKRFNSDDVEDLEQSNYIHLCIGESAMDRERGESVWEAAISGDEDLKMELVWDAVDCYNQSIISARGKCLESEAIAHCQLGKIYGSFFIRQKSREHYKAAIDLELAMRTKNLTSRSWYKEALAGLEKYQKEDRWKENKEKEKIRAPIRAEMKKTLDQLKEASEEGASELIDYIYEKHPPKRGEKPKGERKKRLKKALLHYHPDKQDLETHGLKWIVLSEEITVLLTHHYSHTKC